jgi:hypothetical protein
MKIKTSAFFVFPKHLIALVIIMSLGLFITTSAATFYWAGANGANWNDVNNWSSTASPLTAVTSLPTSADIVRVSENSVTIPSGFDAVASYIVVNTIDEAKPARIIVQQGGSLTSASNNGGSGACLYLRGGAILNQGTITLNVTNAPSGYAMTFENSTVAGVKTASSYLGNGVLIINAAGQTNGGALKFSQTVANPAFTVNNTNNYQFNLASGRWPFLVQSGSNVIINGTGTVDFGTETTPAVYGLFNFISDNCALTVESDVTLNSKSNGTFGPDKGIINIGNFSNVKFTNKGIISMHTNGANGIFCGSTTSLANSIINDGTLSVDGGSAIVFGGVGSASITNTGTFSATNVPSNAYSASVYAGSAGPYIIKNTAPGILNLASGLGISPEIKDDFPSVNVNLIDPQTPVGAKPFLVDNLLPVYSQSHNWDVVFSDEFNDTKIDVTKWSVENKTTFRKNIKIIADEDQVEVVDGNLNICYRKSPTDPLIYYAGRVNTQNKYATTYGYFECRMKIVKPEGYQIAFWMNPTGDGMRSTTPADGTANDGAEIDIIEANKLTDTYSSGMHFDGYGADHKGTGGYIDAPGLHNDEYHYFGLEWSPTLMKFYYDGKVGRTITDPKSIVMVDEYILITGMCWDETGWVQVDVRDNALLNSGGTARAYIDHVRVFKNRATYPPIDQLSESFTENTIVMDNADDTGVTITGDWGSAIGSTPYYKSNYLNDNNSGKGSKSVSFNPALNQAGKYEIYAYSPSEKNRATNTRYIIKRAEGDTTVLVDQTKNGSIWISLGKFNLLNDNNPKVIISNANTSGYVIADAVAFVPLAPVTAVSDLKKAKDIVSVFSDNKEIIVRFNEQTSLSARIDIYNSSGMLIKNYHNIDLSLNQSVRLKPGSHNSSAMHFVKVTIDDKTVCKKVITF